MARFQHGNPGGPGRPKGSKDKKTRLPVIAALVGPRIPAIVSKMLDLAEAGDVGAARLILDRYTPTLKATDRTVDLPELAGAPLDKIPGILRDALAGQRLTPEQAVQLQNIATAQLKQFETVQFAEFARRVQAGEAPAEVLRSMDSSNASASH